VDPGPLSGDGPGFPSGERLGIHMWNRTGNLVRRLIEDTAGSTAVEYALMVALIAAVIITAVALFGGNVNGLFERQDLEDALG
jgi:pilus assembly protein Flp/PilA